MTTTTMIIIVAVAAIVALVLIGRDSGPRVTHIDTKREREDDRDDGASR